MANNTNSTTNNDLALRTCLVWLAVLMAVVGIWTQSFKKVFVTYLVGMFGIAGVLLPDWDFFARDFSRWCSPMTVEEKAALSLRSGFRKKISPLRVAVYSAVYGYGMYKWWRYVSS
ncbi:signal peptidase complex-like protein DTM1 [Euphorbia lathyris]|uniref:signal peptidase complex-like protein DTM1 n=1 Tax=Euphorbia lathyris TaxID=212925 RepID=UPI0033141BC2